MFPLTILVGIIEGHKSNKIICDTLYIILYACIIYYQLIPRTSLPVKKNGRPHLDTVHYDWNSRSISTVNDTGSSEPPQPPLSSSSSGKNHNRSATTKFCVKWLRGPIKRPYRYSLEILIFISLIICFEHFTMSMARSSLYVEIYISDLSVLQCVCASGFLWLSSPFGVV